MMNEKEPVFLDTSGIKQHVLHNSRSHRHSAFF